MAKLGIICGGGALPQALIEACVAKNIPYFAVALEGQCNLSVFDGGEYITARLGQAGKIIKTLKREGVGDLVMIGHVKRPSLKDLKPDLKTAEFFAKEGARVLGDDGLLVALRRFLQKEGFVLHGVQDYMPELLTPRGTLTKVKPTKNDENDIARGIDVIRAMGALDIGQAVVIQDGFVLGVEAAEGTDALIKRCTDLKRKGKAPVLVKLSKPGQDGDLDLPTIGPNTIENVIAAGFAGVAVHAGQSFMFDQSKSIDNADKAKIFITGISPETQF